MERRTILIAETNKPQDKFIKDALLRNNINIEILDESPLNSEEMKRIILNSYNHMLILKTLKVSLKNVAY